MRFCSWSQGRKRTLYNIKEKALYNFNEKDIPTRERPCQMNQKYLDLCKQEIASLLKKKFIKKSYTPYINNAVERERGVPHL